jgi:GNAT superfamily N-acetyltransferase
LCTDPAPLTFEAATSPYEWLIPPDPRPPARVDGAPSRRECRQGFRFVARLAEEWANGASRYDGPGEVLLGSYDGASLVAVGGLTPDPYSGDPGVGRLRHLYVLPAWRGRGIGRRLVGALEAAAASHYLAVVLRTDTAAAAGFYEALGYVSLPVGGTATHWRSLTPAS